MTVAAAWVGQLSSGRKQLWIASDSRVTGGHTMDACPKILTLPRSDAVLCFAGSTDAAYPLMRQIANAIAAHQPARDRAMDLLKLKNHVVRVCTDLIGRFRGRPTAFVTREVQLLLAGYSWDAQRFAIWTIAYQSHAGAFVVREAGKIHERLHQAAFIGDQAKGLRSLVVREGNAAADGRPFSLEPLRLLSKMLTEAPATSTIGGPPQVVRVATHMNTRPYIVRWEGQDTLFGRPLFPYESIDYWIIDPVTGIISKPRGIGVGAPAIEPVAPEPPIVDGGSTPEVQ